MPGRTDLSLGKRKRICDGFDDSKISFKKTLSSGLQEQMALDNVYYTSDLPSPFAGITQLSQSPNHSTQSPPRSKRKLAQLRAPRQDLCVAKSTPDFASLKSVVQTPCHRCYNAPLRKKDLDSYTDCERCLQRTCLVCLRQCGCQKKICADCSVEEGSEGDIYCLDCFGKIHEDSPRPADQHHLNDREMEE